MNGVGPTEIRWGLPSSGSVGVSHSPPQCCLYSVPSKASPSSSTSLVLPPLERKPCPSTTLLSPTSMASLSLSNNSRERHVSHPPSSLCLLYGPLLTLAFGTVGHPARQRCLPMRFHSSSTLLLASLSSCCCALLGIDS